MKPVYSVLILGLALFYSSDGIAQTSDSAYTAQAVAKYNQRLYSEAINLCNIVLKRNPKHAWAYNIRGLATAGLGYDEKAKSNEITPEVRSYFENAMADYTRAIGIDPNYQVAYSNRAYSAY